MSYGILKVDTITFTDSGIDKSVSISGLVQNPTFSGNITATGTISGNTVQGQTVSGVTVTGTTANFTSGVFTNISGGIYTFTSGVFAAGSAANPSISFTSDPNTGLYSPGADQVAISTNGTGRLFVNADGNVAVGTSSPSTTWGRSIKIEGVSNAAVEITEGTVDTALISAAGSFGIVGTTSNHPFYIRTNGTERLRITSDGKVGLGTSSPSELLTVGGATVNIGLFNSTPGTTVSPSFSTINFYGFSQDANGNIASISAGNSQTNEYGGVLRFSTNTTGATHTERMRIDSSGRVGIGTTSPDERLTLGAASKIKLNRADNATGATIHNGGGLEGLIFNELNAEGCKFQNNGTTVLRIDSLNRVGIGTTSPGSALDIRGDFTFANSESAYNTNYYGVLHSENAGDTGYLQFRGASGLGKAIGVAGFGTETVLFAGSTERARIDSSGRLGLGTSSPAAALDVVGQINSTTGYASNKFGVNNSAIPVTTSTAESFARFKTTGSDFYIGTESSTGGAFFPGSTAYSAVLYNASSTPLHFYTAAVVRATIDSSGNVGIGTTSPSAKLHVATAGNNYIVSHNTTGSTSALLLGAESGSTALYSWTTVGGSTGVPLKFVTGASEAMRLDTSGRLLVGTSSQSGGSLLQVNDDRIRIASSKTPASASDTGTAGEICWDADYIYVCTATDTWKRTAISTW